MNFARTRLILLALPLALGLTSCGKKDDASGGTAASATPIAKIAAPAGKAWTDMISTTPDGGYVMGNPNAPLKLIEYGSLTCPHCAVFATEGFPKLRDSYVADGRVSIEFRNFVRDKFDTTMAMLTRCGPPESFFALTEQVFANQKDIFKGLDALQSDPTINTLPEDKLFPVLATKAGLVDFFAARGVAKDQAMACLAKTQTATDLAAGVQKATDQFNIQGTPSFILNGKNVEVATWEELEPILQKAGAR
jgi:protein-disulfide isomerase